VVCNVLPELKHINVMRQNASVEGAKGERDAVHRRPVSELLNDALDAAHSTYEKRHRENKLHYNATALYERFDQASRAATAESWSYEDGKCALFGPEIWSPSAVGQKTTAFSSMLHRQEVQGIYKFLEVSCQYDEAKQRCDTKGRAGQPVRPAAVPTLGPVATLFRWYARRSNRLGSFSPDDLAPKPVVDREGAARKAMNTDDDPVLNCGELIGLLEDFEVVPGQLRRGDVQSVCRLVQSARGTGHPLPNPHPAELRYPEFCRALVRLALLTNCEPSRLGDPLADSLRLKALCDRLMVSSQNTTPLRLRLASMSANARDKGRMRKEKRWEYALSESAFEATRRDHAAAWSPSPEAGWDPTRPSEVPPELMAQLLANDKPLPAQDERPRWKAFEGVKIDMGKASIGDVRNYRIVLRNRTKRKVHLEINFSGPPWLTANFSEMPLAEGMPRVVELTARFEEEGEFNSTVEVVAREASALSSHTDVTLIPLYARVVRE